MGRWPVGKLEVDGRMLFRQMPYICSRYELEGGS